MSDIVSILGNLKIDDPRVIAELTAKLSIKKAFPRLDIAVADHINVDAIVGPVQSLVDDFNQLPGIIEENRSIGKANSVHHLWHGITQLLSKTDFGSFCKNNVRVVYEWNIPDDMGPWDNERDHHIDFAFLPNDMSALRWIHLRGGLELKMIDGSEEEQNEASTGPTHTTLDARRAKWFHRKRRLGASCKPRGELPTRSLDCRGKRGAHAAFCCFADIRQFGVVTEDNVVLLDVSPVYTLAGIGQGEVAYPLRLLAHLLYSPAQDLVGAELISLPNDISPVIKGRNENEEEVEWAPDLFLGRGGFAEVFTDRESPFVIKRVREEATKKSLVPEHLALTRLQGLLKAVLYDENNDIEALKFQDPGISLRHYLREIAYSEEELNAVMHVVGPAVVRSLQVVHSLGVMHNDVRQPNILLVPRDKNQSKTLVPFRRDITAGDIPSFLTTFRVVLNDWCNASSTTSDSEHVSLPSSDLEAVVMCSFRARMTTAFHTVENEAWERISGDLQHSHSHCLSLYHIYSTFNKDGQVSSDHQNLQPRERRSNASHIRRPLSGLLLLGGLLSRVLRTAGGARVHRRGLHSAGRDKKRPARARDADLLLRLRPLRDKAEKVASSQIKGLSAYRLRVNTRPEEVMQRMEEYHGRESGGSWLCTSYQELCRELFRLQTIAVAVGAKGESVSFRLCSVELCDEEGNMVAGELGYLTGSVFTSLSGFCTREKRLSLGKIQILALAMRFEELGFKWLNLGQPPSADGVMRYKTELGARTMERAEFLARWIEDIRCPARIEEFAATDVTLGHLLQTLNL